MSTTVLGLNIVERRSSSNIKMQSVSNHRIIEILDGARMGREMLDLTEMTSGVGRAPP